MPLSKTCPVCGKTFSTKDKRQKYCCYPCAVEAKTNRTTSICAVCSNEFTHLASRNRLYCSTECSDIGRRTVAPRECAHCGKPYITYQKDQRFCSVQCRADSQNTRIQKICPICGQPFETLASKDAIHCSATCRGKASRTRFMQTCTRCGKQYESVPSVNSENTYCSRTCFHADRAEKQRENAKPHIVRSCITCGKQFTDPKHPTRVYCSRECMNQRKRSTRIVKICITCGKEFEVPPSLGHLARCSFECGREPHFKPCEVCGTTFQVKTGRLDSAKYCSKACYAIDWVKNLRKRMRLNGPTKPERKVRDALDQLGIQYVAEKRFKTYLVDFFLPDHDIALEVDGDYWHTLPSSKDRDARKDKFLCRKGYRVVRIWESEINTAECVTTLVAQRLDLID